MSIVIDEDITTKQRIKEPRKYNIWALNNNSTSFDEVVIILINAFNMSSSVASELTRKVDTEGKAKVNPKPMSRGIAEAQLNKINTIKRNLASSMPFRKKEIMMLEFIIKAD